MAALVIQTPDKQTLTLMLSAMNSAYYIDYGAPMLAIVIATIPLSVIFTLQRYLCQVLLVLESKICVRYVGKIIKTKGE